MIRKLKNGNYEITEQLLLTLLAMSNKLEALELRGVSDWEGYQTAIDEHFEETSTNNFEECAQLMLALHTEGQ